MFWIIFLNTLDKPQFKVYTVNTNRTFVPFVLRRYTGCPACYTYEQVQKMSYFGYGFPDRTNEVCQIHSICILLIALRTDNSQYILIRLLLQKNHFTKLLFKLRLNDTTTVRLLQWVIFSILCKTVDIL